MSFIRQTIASLLVAFIFINQPHAQVDVALPAPTWTRDAVIAELPVRGFAMDNYNTITGDGQGTFKGITQKLDFLKSLGINVICLYSVYDCTKNTSLFVIRFDQTSLECGTIDDVKELCTEAHKRGMHVISNTNYYGVDRSSPLLTEHPDWFTTEEMFTQPKFNWKNSDAFNYVVNAHVMWCIEVGLDGFRVDCGAIYWEKSVFDAIITSCDQKGKRILLTPQFIHLRGHILGAGSISANTIWDMSKSINGGVTIEDPYRAMDWSSHNTGAEWDSIGKYGAVNLKTNGVYCGREGAFRIRGSQFLYGFNMLFGTHVPWFMAGEAFNATHLMTPNNTSGSYSKMLHTYIDWNDTISQADVITDFRTIARLRQENSDVFHNNQAETHIVNISCNTDVAAKATPYARFIPGMKALIVVGNDNIANDITFTLHIPLETMKLDKFDLFQVDNLWLNTTRIMTKEQLASYSILVPKDKSANGGIRVIKITPLLSN